MALLVIAQTQHGNYECKTESGMNPNVLAKQPRSSASVQLAPAHTLISWQGPYIELNVAGSSLKLPLPVLGLERLANMLHGNVPP